jgi:hypothetical protein
VQGKNRDFGKFGSKTGLLQKDLQNSDVFFVVFDVVVFVGLFIARENGFLPMTCQNSTADWLCLLHPCGQNPAAGVCFIPFYLPSGKLT